MAEDIANLHRYAGGGSGNLILASFGEDSSCGKSLRPRIEAFAQGDVSSMVARAVELASEPHRNVYAGLATMRADLASGRKGGEGDIVGVFGLTADFDSHSDAEADAWEERLPLPPTMVLQTSGLPKPSYQCRYVFKAPIPPAEAKEIARSLQAVSGCDSCTIDLSHVWRVAGGLNWPNRLKVEKYDRPQHPQLVRVVLPFDHSRLVSADALTVALSVSTPVQGVTPAEGANEALAKAPRIALNDLDHWGVPTELKKIIELGRGPAKNNRQDNSRSSWLFKGVRGLVRYSVPPETILSIITDPAFGISDSVRDKGRRAIDYARRQIARASAESADPGLEAFNSEHAVVENYGSRTMMVTFDSKDKISIRSFEDFKRSYDNIKVKVTRNGKISFVGQGTAFIDNPHRRQYKSVIFLPGQEADDGVLNLYRGPSIVPAPGECGKFLDFVLSIICDGDEEHCNWLLDATAHIYQKPWETPEVCLILRGRQGVGKNFFVECLGEIVGDYFIVISNPKHLVGGFNRHLMDKLLVLADEALYGDEKKYAGILKNLVTQTHMAVEPKGVDVFMAKKYFRLFMASNEDFVVPADLDDRRMFVIDVSDARAKDHEYFADLRLEWDTGGREAFYDRMLKRDISAFNHRSRPETAGLTDQKVESLVGADRLMFEMLASGEAPLAVQQLVGNFIPTEMLVASYSRKGIKASSRAVGVELALIAMIPESKRESVNSRQMRGFWVPSLAECRAAWSRAKKVDPSWPNDDGDWINTFNDEPF